MGGSGCESDVGGSGGGSGQGKAREMEQGWTDFGLDVLGKFLYEPLGASLIQICYLFRPCSHPGNSGDPGWGRPGGLPGW